MDNKFLLKLGFELHSYNPEQREYAARELTESGDPRAVDLLIDALRDSGEDRRREFVCVLGRVKDRRVVDAVAETLSDKSVDVRYSAIEALESIGDPAAVEPLIGALRDSSDEIRAKAAGVLGSLRDRRAVQPLIDSVGDESPKVRGEVARALGRVGDTQAVESLIAALRDGEPSVREFAAMALEGLGDARAVEPFIETLRDPNVSIRRTAARALSTLRDARSVEPLIEILRDQDYYVRSTAVDTLFVLGDPRAVRPLIEMLRDSDGSIVESALSAIERLGDGQSIGPLLDVVCAQPGGRYEKCLGRVLTQLSDARSVSALLATFRTQPNPTWLRKAALTALTKAGDGTLIGPLLADVSHAEFQPREEVLAVVIQLADEQSVTVLVHALRSPQRDIRRTAADALRKLDWRPADTTQHFWRAFAEEDLPVLAKGGAGASRWLALAAEVWAPQQRVQAVKALGQLGPAALPMLVKLAIDDGPDIDRQWEAVRALQALNRRPPTQRGRFLLALDANDERARKAGGMLLAMLPHPRAFPLLGALGEPNTVEKLVNFLGTDHHAAAMEAIVQILPDPPARCGSAGYHTAPTHELCCDAVRGNETKSQWINSNSQCFPSGDGQSEGYLDTVIIDRSNQRREARLELLRRAQQHLVGNLAVVAVCSNCDKIYRLVPQQAGRQVRCPDCREWFHVPELNCK